MLLDFFGGLLLTAAIVVNVNAVVSALRVSRLVRLVLASLVGLWIGLQVSLATAGAFGSEFALQFPLIGLMVLLPPVAVGLAAWRSHAVRAALMDLPTPLLVGLNASRVFGAFFLLLVLAGRLEGPFPYSAGWGDIITGAIALPLAVMMARGAAGHGSLVAWNLFGALDLIIAVLLGTFSFPGPQQLINSGVGSSAVQFLPWVLIPTVLVPFYLILHGVIFAQLQAGRSPGQAEGMAA